LALTDSTTFFPKFTKINCLSLSSAHEWGVNKSVSKVIIDRRCNKNLTTLMEVKKGEKIFGFDGRELLIEYILLLILLVTSTTKKYFGSIK